MSKSGPHFLIAVIPILGIFIFFIIYQQQQLTKFSGIKAGKDNVIIMMTETGFPPDPVTVKQGTTLIFENADRISHWPASDIHPTHGIYPEFDPKEPIEPGQSWSFHFTKPGRWEYHDHLFPLLRGVIIIQGEKEQGTSEKQDWALQIEEVLNQKGIATAFDVVSALYSQEPDFARDCHGYVHEIGERAYELFSQGKEMKLSPKTSYCGYGFYHGFMETLLLTTGDLKQAQDFCEYVDNQLYEKAQGASAACYHGVGHGTVDGGDPRSWGSAQAMMKPGFEMCELVAETEHQLYLCVTGVFNSIQVLSTNPKYKLPQIQQDPFFICDSQAEKFQEPCYTNMIPALLGFTKNDLLKAARFIENEIANDKDYAIRKIVLSGLFHEFIRLNLANENYIQEGVELCRGLKEQSRLPCVDGLSGGHMKYGEPTREYVKGLAFCGSEILAQDEKEVCFEHILSRLRLWYSRDKSQAICEMVEEKYRSFCHD